MSYVDYSETNPSPEVAASRHARGGLYIVAFASTLVALLSIYSCVQLNAENSWVKTDAAVVKTIAEDTGREKLLKITYRYKIGSKTVTATETQSVAAIRSLNEKSTVSDVEVLQKGKDRLDKNKNISVYYKPSSPTESRIVGVDLSKLIILFAGLAGACIGIAVASVWALCNPRRPPSESTGHYIVPKPNINRQAILDSLREPSSKVDSQVGSVLPESIASDNSTTENSLDVTTINVKKTEKETR